jgi:hypothetical protein
MTHPKSSEIAREIVESAWKAVDTDEGADYRPLDKALIKRITAAIVEARASALPSREEVFEAFKNYYGKTGNGLRWQGGVFVYDWLTENMTAGLKSVDDVPSREPTEDEYNQVIEVNGVSYVTLKNHRDKMKAASSVLKAEESRVRSAVEKFLGGIAYRTISTRDEPLRREIVVSEIGLNDLKAALANTERPEVSVWDREAVLYALEEGDQYTRADVARRLREAMQSKGGG